MARATRVYLVVEPDYDGDHVYAAFTVKHECKTFLQRTKHPFPRMVLSLPDGGGSAEQLRLSEEAFLASRS